MRCPCKCVLHILPLSKSQRCRVIRPVATFRCLLLASVAFGPRVKYSLSSPAPVLRVVHAGCGGSGCRPRHVAGCSGVCGEP
jgi:hypothetical protein